MSKEEELKKLAKELGYILIEPNIDKYIQYAIKGKK